jgi:hypothetical protein
MTSRGPKEVLADLPALNGESDNGNGITDAFHTSIDRLHNEKACILVFACGPRKRVIDALKIWKYSYVRRAECRRFRAAQPL